MVKVRDTVPDKVDANGPVVFSVATTVSVAAEQLVRVAVIFSGTMAVLSFGLAVNVAVTQGAEEAAEAGAATKAVAQIDAAAMAAIKRPLRTEQG